MNRKRLDGNTAVLVFSHSAAKEAERKRFLTGSGIGANRRIAQHLIRSTRKTVKQSGLPSHFVFSQQQKGKTFGERLANSLEGLFAKGYQKIIVVGNDCRDLSAVDIQKAAGLLQEKDMVLGPDLDGGVYLIGIDRKRYSRSSFISLLWESAELQSSFREDIATGKICWLGIKADIDNAVDFTEFLKSLLPFVSLFKLVQSIRAAFIPQRPNRGINLRSLFQYNSPSLRGPPC